MPERKHDDVEVIPLPGQETEAERRRVRQSNDRDQQAEQHGKQTPHNRGYDQAADGPSAPLPDPLED